MSTLPQEPNELASRTLADGLHDALREDIVRGRLLPGEHINERALARAWGASRTPVREALRRLEQAGLVTRDGRSRYVVRPFSLAEMDQLYDVRIALEDLAIRTIGAISTPERLAVVRAAWKAFPDSGDPSDALNADEAFHESVVRACENVVLAEFLTAINERIHVMRRIDFTATHRWAETRREHGQVLEALESGQVDEAASLMRAHILRSKAKVAELANEGLAQVYLRQPRTDIN